MNTEAPDPFLARAIEWHVRLRDGDGDTWEAFAEWLAEDTRNVEAYDKVEALDARIEPLLPEVNEHVPANDVGAPPHRKALAWIGGALAASIAAGVLVVPHLGSDRYEIATAAGEQRSVRIDAETQLTLNGDTKITLDRKDLRFAALEHGQAIFQVRHDEKRPFVLEVGKDRVVDLGTVFDVVHDGTETRVAVAEGKVSFERSGREVTLDAGQALATVAGKVRVSTTSADAVGAWRQKRFLYSGAPLSQVAADLARTLGISIKVEPSIARRPITGNVSVTGVAAEDIRRVELALDVRLERQGNTWVMKPSGRAGQ